MFSSKQSLQFYVSSIFFSIIFILSILQITLSYQDSKKLNTLLAKEQALEHAKQIQLAFEYLTIPMRTTLGTLASTYFNQMPLQIETEWLRLIDSIIKNNPALITINIGYQNDESIIIQAFQHSFMRKKFDAPDDAIFLIDISRDQNKRERNFFNRTFDVIKTENYQIHYRPTTRPWYKSAPLNGETAITTPYFYQFIQENGVSLVQRLANNQGVIAVGMEIGSINDFLASLPFSQHSQFVLFNEEKAVIAEHGLLEEKSKTLEQTQYQQRIKSSPLASVYQQKTWESQSKTVNFNSQQWQVDWIKINIDGTQHLWLAKAIPVNQLISTAIVSRNDLISSSFLLAVLGIILILWASKKIAIQLKQFQKAIDQIRYLDFKDINLPFSNIYEINELSISLQQTSNTIVGFLNVLQQVSQNSNFEEMLVDIVSQCHKDANADYAVMWLTDDQEHSQTMSRDCANHATLKNLTLPQLKQVFPDLDEKLNSNQIYLVSPKKQQQGVEVFPSDVERVWILPLINRRNKSVGCVMLCFKTVLSSDQEVKMHFIHTFLGFINIIKESRSHLDSHTKLLNAFVKLFASAIDTKSPYTGGHCQRVPELSFMLAEKAAQDVNYFPDYELNSEARESLHLAAWLHDCGKVTTPEYIVDKATKLETIYNRIHEIRTRFEVLKRDVEITYWRQRCAGKDTQALNEWLINEHRQLDQDFEFIAKCNSGSEKMTSEDFIRLTQIAKRTWLRTIDDQLGLSWEEASRRAKRIDNDLPQREFLLDDRVDHLIAWSTGYQEAFKTWPFNLIPPQQRQNQGELYNLSIEYGTLNDEERFIINDHIIQTIKILNKLPYPHHLERIPEIASGHHERMDGKGYPYGLTKNELSLDARIIALADVFEALTAPDRPYKKAKTLNESLMTLAKMVKNQHLDKELFLLFIEQKIYLDYAIKFLDNSQIDEVDETSLMAMIS